MVIKSIACNNGGPIAPRYLANISPPLDISAVPTGTQSLALILHDPDAVSGDYIHWALWDIPPTTTTILENTIPETATQGLTTASTPDYVPPRPPRGSGRHHYTFELFALDAPLDLLPSTPPPTVLTTLRKRAIATTSLTGVIDA